MIWSRFLVPVKAKQLSAKAWSWWWKGLPKSVANLLKIQRYLYVSVYLPIEILPLWFSEKDFLRPKQPKPKQALKVLNCSHGQPYGYDATMGHLGRFFHVGVLRELCQDHRKQGLQCSCTLRHVPDSGCAKLLCFVFVMHGFDMF